MTQWNDMVVCTDPNCNCNSECSCRGILSKRYFLHGRTGKIFGFRGTEEIDNVTLADCLRDTEYFKEITAE